MYSSAFSFWENYQTLSKSMKSVRENVIKTVDVTSVLLRPSVCECITSRELGWQARIQSYAFEFIYLSSDQYLAITLLFAV